MNYKHNIPGIENAIGGRSMAGWKGAVPGAGSNSDNIQNIPHSDQKYNRPGTIY